MNLQYEIAKGAIVVSEENLSPYQKIFFIITKPEFLVLLTITYHKIVILLKIINQFIIFKTT